MSPIELIYKNVKANMDAPLTRRNEFYRKRKERLWNMYWKDNDGSDIFRPNGFDSYPEEVYDLFLSLVDHDGDVIDLGCGNGLMLSHLLKKSKHKLVPHGVDFMEESIKQAKERILPNMLRISKLET